MIYCQNSSGRLIVNVELERMRKEAVLACVTAAFVPIVEARPSRLRGLSAQCSADACDIDLLSFMALDVNRIWLYGLVARKPFGLKPSVLM